MAEETSTMHQRKIRMKILFVIFKIFHHKWRQRQQLLLPLKPLPLQLQLICIARRSAVHDYGS